MNKIWDIEAPLDEWERRYARLAYLHTKLKMVGALKIEVSYE